MSEPVKTWPRDRLCALIEEFGLDPKDVTHIDIDPSVVRVRVFRTNEEGRRYVGDKNQAASVTWDIAIR